MKGEGTEPPTPRRLREARRRGEVARSADLVGALVLVAGGLGALGLARGAVHAVEALTRALFAAPGIPAAAALHLAAGAALRAGAPLVALLAAVGVAASVVQTGPLFAPEAVRVDPGRLHPARGLKNLATFARLGIVVKTAVAFAGVLLVGRLVAGQNLVLVLALPRLGPLAAGRCLARLGAGLVAGSGAALVLLGALDLVLARRRIERRLRMSKEEVREERRRDEGDPAHKAERKRAHRSVLAGPVRPLSDAKVVVVNPTHVSVALHFDDGLDAPVVGRRGTGAAAARIRADARRLGIPLVRDVPLARALLAVDPGDEVPEALYAAVAAVLTAVHRVAAAHRRQP